MEGGDGRKAEAMTEAPEPVLTTEQGPWGGPVYAHRGAEIRCAKGGHVCALLLEGHPLDMPLDRLWHLIMVAQHAVDLLLNEIERRGCLADYSVETNLTRPDAGMVGG
jgi:hypothetical protein